MKKHMRTFTRGAAAICAAVLSAAALPVSAEDTEAAMTLRLDAEQKYVTQDQLAEGDLLIPAKMYIDNYSGISTMMLHLLSDAPLHIENGDFTRDPSRKEIEIDLDTELEVERDKQCYFVDHGTARYTQYSDVTGLENAVLWYATGWMENEVGTVEDPESSFLSFDVRIPQGTPAGQYTCYLASGERPAPGGKTTPEFYLRNGSTDIADQVILTPLTITVEPDYLPGDVNCDGLVDIADAQRALIYYVNMLSSGSLTDERQAELFGTPYIHTAYRNANVVADDAVQADDAQCILQYCVEKLSGKDVTWEDILPK